MSQSGLLAGVLQDDGEDALDRSLRPRHLGDFVGQERVKEQLAIALEAIGDAEGALDLLDRIQLLRDPGGAYRTGWQYVTNRHYPNEQSSYTAAAIVLAVLTGVALYGVAQQANAKAAPPAAAALRSGAFLVVVSIPGSGCGGTVWNVVTTGLVHASRNTARWSSYRPSCQTP